MKKEDKELLFKDLCSRLPYHVKCKIWLEDGTTEEGLLDLEHNYGNVLQDVFYYNKIKNIKPYLRPMSSMTEDEKNYINYKWDADEYGNMMAFSSYEGGVSEIELADIVGFQDWLNKNMFDYRGLIEKNIALDCTGLHVYD